MAELNNWLNARGGWANKRMDGLDGGTGLIKMCLIGGEVWSPVKGNNLISEYLIGNAKETQCHGSHF